MNAKYFKTFLVGSICFVLILVAVLFITSKSYAAMASPFVGAWYATDWDGSELRLVIAGPTKGLYSITIIDSAIGYCDGEAGIIRGTGQLNLEDSDVLETDLQLNCRRAGETLEIHGTLRYHPSTGMLSSGVEDGYVIIWHKYQQPVLPPPELTLRVNYRGDWVDGPYEVGHTAWVTVTESDGVTVKGHTQLITELWPYWWGASGFATTPKTVSDIQPGDWVYAWVDNGASAKLQVGEINGMINLFADSIEGTINASQLPANVEVQCFKTGAPQAEADIRYDSVRPDGTDPYYCSWEGYWDIQPNNRVGVAYIDPSGNWVINTFFATDCISPPAGMSGWWPGDGNADDLIFGNGGNFQGDATTGSGLVGLAFRLDGDGDFIDIPDSPGLNFGPGDFTVDLWVNFETLYGEQVLVEKWIQADPESKGWTLTKLDTQVLRLAMANGSGWDVSLDADISSIQPGSWNHFAATRNGPVVTLYMNGNAIAYQDIGAINLDSSASLKFGHRGNPVDTPGSDDNRGFYLNGRIDEVEIFNGTALTGEQILELYTAGGGGKCKANITTPQVMNLRVNYGHDWVESSYEADHSVKIMVTGSDGETIKATTTMITGPRDEWGGDTGFNSGTAEWIPSLPDIQPFDWVFAWVDNGASARVQLGEISGTIDLANDSIKGTVYAPWFSPQVEIEVECHSWGAPPPEILVYDWVLPDGIDTYTCSWAGVWDIDYYQTVGVGYSGPDGGWVANAFFERNPYIKAYPAGDYIEGFEWPLDAWVHLAIDDPATETNPDFELDGQVVRTPWDPNYYWVQFGFGGQYDLKIGDEVTISYEGVIRTHIVQNLSITEVNYIANSVSGLADDDKTVHFWVWDIPESYREITPTGGAWSVDYGQALDLVEGMCGRAEIPDEQGNSTDADWCVPIPRFTVFPEWNYIQGWQWLDGVNVDISVQGKETCSIPVTSGYPEGSTETFFEVNFPAGCALQAGDVITVTDYDVTRVMTIQNVSVTNVDKFANTVAGTADPGATVYAWVHGYGETNLELNATDGTWLANFGAIPFDLVEGMGGRAEIRDLHGDSTAVDWYIPNPRFTIFPEGDWFDAMDWPTGANVEVSVAGKPECGFVRESPGNFFNGGFPEGCDVAIGDTVMFTDGQTYRSHIVQKLAVTGVDALEDTVAGIANPGAVVNVWPHATGQTLQATAGLDETWQVDFTGTYDLPPGACGRAQINDAEGNATAVDWCLPAPRIRVQITDDWIAADNFTPNTEITFWVNGELLVEPGQIVSDSNGNAWLNLAGMIDLVPGDTVDVTDDTVVKSVTLEAITFDVFDPTTGYFQGTAPEPYYRPVWVGLGWENDWWSADVNTDVYGNWSASYGGQVPGNLWWAAAQIFDEDGDVSEVRPSARSQVAGNFTIAWSQTRPEEVIYLSWRGSGNLTRTNGNEFFGQGITLENETDPGSRYYNEFAGWCTTGDWSQEGLSFAIDSISACEWASNLPIHTSYQFDESRPDLIKVERTIDFGQSTYSHTIRAFIPRLAPIDGFSQLIHPNAEGTALEFSNTFDYPFGGILDNWDGSWFALNDPITGRGMIVQRVFSPYQVALWADYDDATSSNSSGFLLLPPAEGFTGSVTETEYLCFYDGSTWTPDLALPAECKPNLNPQIFGMLEQGYIQMRNFSPTARLSISIYDAPGGAELWSGTRDMGGNWLTGVSSGEIGLDLFPGYYVTASDGIFTRSLVLEWMLLGVIDAETNVMMGIAPPGRQVWVAAGPAEWQLGKFVTADPETGMWFADLTGIVDITEDMYIWSYSQISDEDGDVNEGDIAPNHGFTLDGAGGWLDSGIDLTADVEITILAAGEVNTANLAEYPGSYSGPDGQVEYQACGVTEGEPPCALDGAFFGALVGKIGAEGTPFLIGSRLTFTPAESGDLYLADNDYLDYYSDNGGHFFMIIK